MKRRPGVERRRRRWTIKWFYIKDFIFTDIEKTLQQQILLLWVENMQQRIMKLLKQENKLNLAVILKEKY